MSVAGEGYQRIDAALNKIKRISRAACVFFRFAAVICAFFGIALFFFFSVSLFWPGTFDLSILSHGGILGISVMVLLYVTACCALWVAQQVFNEISKGQSPFTKRHSQQIRLIGCILLFGVFIDAIASIGFAPTVQVGDFNLGYTLPPGVDNSVLHINAQSIVMAIICFSLSIVFDYGSLLQKLSDDTV